MNEVSASSSLVKASKRTAGRQPRRHFLHNFGGDLLILCILATVCLCASVVLDQLRDHPLPLFYKTKADRLRQTLTRLNPNLEGTQTGEAKTTDEPVMISSVATNIPHVIGLEEFQKLVQSKGGIVLDARPEIFHRLGHVPGALSLPREEFERDYVHLRGVLEPARNREVVVYCSNASCEDSQMVADALVKLGYHHVLVFKDGWSEWTRAALPEEHS